MAAGCVESAGSPSDFVRGDSGAPSLRDYSLAVGAASDHGVTRWAQAPIEWTAYESTAHGTKFSRAAQVHRGNVKQLVRAWEFRTGDLLEGQGSGVPIFRPRAWPLP